MTTTEIIAEIVPADKPGDAARVAVQGALAALTNAELAARQADADAALREAEAAFHAAQEEYKRAWYRATILRYEADRRAGRVQEG